jgi:hypothetical protein
LASTRDIGERTRNEASWNAHTASLIRNLNVQFFDVPQVYETGFIEDKFYYISEFYGGRKLATKPSLNVEGLDRWLDTIVKVNLFLLSIQYHNPLPYEKGRHLKSWGNYFEIVKKMYEAVKEHGLREILEAVQMLRDTYKPAINHGDFVPWHMIEHGSKLILIDGEVAGTNFAKYHDVAYFYHRVYTSAHAPSIAKEYLNKVRDELPSAEKYEFDRSIKPILAERIIGGFWDAKTRGISDLTFHHNLKTAFLNNAYY